MNTVPKYYSLEAEEKRVENNLIELTRLVSEYALPEKPPYIQEEIIFLQRELAFLKEEINKKIPRNYADLKLTLVKA